MSLSEQECEALDWVYAQIEERGFLKMMSQRPITKAECSIAVQIGFDMIQKDLRAKRLILL